MVLLSDHAFSFISWKHIYYAKHVKFMVARQEVDRNMRAEAAVEVLGSKSQQEDI
jgi:hypothetical protein